jgi:diguanylate cyclase
LEKVAQRLQSGLAKHQSNLATFKRQLAELNDQPEEPVWKDFCRQTLELLNPTLELATQMTEAYDEVCHQTVSLMSFSDARTDPLTAVRNRHGFEESLDWQLTMNDRYNTGFSVAIFDLDGFKLVNDHQGHPDGDRLLQRFAAMLTANARASDVVARFGGDEFVVLMPHTDMEGASALAERVRLSVAQELPVTASGGVAAAMGGESREALVGRADAALYQAKAAGRNRIFCHTDADIRPISETSQHLAASEPTPVCV